MALDNDLLTLWLAAEDFDRDRVRTLIENLQATRQHVYDADALFERVHDVLGDILIDADRIATGKLDSVEHGLENIYDAVNGLLDELEVRRAGDDDVL
jgi:hypothetical protein